MHRKPSHYPISQLIFNAFLNYEKKVSEFVSDLGYKNIAKGIRSFDYWLINGCGTVFFLRQLISLGKIDVSKVNNALLETDKIMELEYQEDQQEEEKKRRKNFKPYIFVETSEKRPRQITFAGLMNLRMRSVLIDFEKEGVEEDHFLKLASDRVKQHFVENDGKCLFFGEITGYIVISDYERHYRLDINGNILERKDHIFRIPFSGGVSFRNKTLPQIFII